MPQKLKQKLSDRRDKALRLLEVVQEHEQRRQPRQQQGSQDPLTPELNEYLDTRIRRFLDERPSPSQTIRASKRGDGRKKTVNAQPQRIAKGAGTAAPPISKIVALDSEAAAGQCINETCPICCTTFSETRHKLVALL